MKIVGNYKHELFYRIDTISRADIKQFTIGMVRTNPSVHCAERFLFQHLVEIMFKNRITFAKKIVNIFFQNSECYRLN